MHFKYHFEFDESRGHCYNLMASLEEAADANANDLGFGVLDLRRSNRTWMMYGLSVSIQEPISPGPLTVATWPSGSEGILVFRDFEIVQGNQVIGSASSSWLVVDRGSRKLVNDNPLRQMISKHNSLPCHSRPESIDIPICTDDFRSSYVIEDSMLDHNKHLNNKYYIEFSTRKHEAQGFAIRNLQFQFKREAFAGQVVNVLTCPESPSAYLHKMYTGKEEQIIALAKSDWFI